MAVQRNAGVSGASRDTVKSIKDHEPWTTFTNCFLKDSCTFITGRWCVNISWDIVLQEENRRKCWTWDSRPYLDCICSILKMLIADIITECPIRLKSIVVSATSRVLISMNCDSERCQLWSSTNAVRLCRSATSKGSLVCPAGVTSVFSYSVSSPDYLIEINIRLWLTGLDLSLNQAWSNGKEIRKEWRVEGRKEGKETYSEFSSAAWNTYS